MTSNTERGGRRTAPYAFTEQGFAMLSSVLDSQESALAVSTAAIRPKRARHRLDELPLRANCCRSGFLGHRLQCSGNGH